LKDNSNAVTLRYDVHREDIENIRNIVVSTGYFDNDEIEVAVELIEEYLHKGKKSGYNFIFADCNNETVGYSCYGLIPCTKISYDLYWIAVSDQYQGRGIGRELLNATENLIRIDGGKQIFVETSSKEQYQSTRAFYEKCRYDKSAEITNFYDYNDNKIIYVKKI